MIGCKSWREPIKEALAFGVTKAVESTCRDFLSSAAKFYGVKAPTIRVLAARPIRIWESGFYTELFGDYHIGKAVIRVWMRTAVHQRITSFGTFLSTLCHEFCHHLDYEGFRFRDSFHTRGFYERAAVLYHHARATPKKKLFWNPMPGGRWKINWPRTNRLNG